MLWSIAFSIFAVCAACLHWRYKNRHLLAMARNFPGPKTVPFFGNALMVMGSGSEFITVIKNLITNYEGTVRFWLGPDVNFVVSNPNDLKILLTSPKTSIKGLQYKYMADVLGGGLLSGSGPKWRKHRKIAAPYFSKGEIESYCDIFNNETGMLIERMKQLPMGEMIDIYYHIVRGTTYSVLRTIMGLTREETLKLPFLDAVISDSPRLYQIIFHRMTKWYLQIDPIYWLNPRHQEMRSFEKKLWVFCNAIIQYRIKYLNSFNEHEKSIFLNLDHDEKKIPGLSVIDRLILSRELNSDELKREAFTFFTASQEASAKTISGLLLMMAFHPECQKKLYAEVRRVLGDTDREVTDEDLKKMVYLDMVYREVLRLFPIGAILQRTIKEDITISTGTLPAGGSLLIPIYHLHRDPLYWSEPDAFDPGRFKPENCKKRNPNCYMPFSFGPMDCLGRYYASKLIKTISARVIREFEVTSSQSYKDLELSIEVSATSLHGYHVILNPRK